MHPEPSYPALSTAGGSVQGFLWMLCLRRNPWILSHIRSHSMLESMFQLQTLPL